MSNTPITESEVKQFIRDWFHKLDKHPNPDEMLPFVARELKINTPAKKDEPFEGFYNGAAKYRDQIHTIKALEIITSPDTATVKVIVRWERSDSKSPSPGTRLASYAAQTWTLERSPQPPGLHIVAYNVDYLLDEVHPLADAIRYDHDTAKNLLSQGYDVNKKDAAGLTPLMIAAGLGDEGMVKLLLNVGADVFITDSSMGTTALHKAAQCGSVEVAELLLNKGAFIDAQAPTLGNTPLLDAVWHKHKGMVECLLKRKARTELTMRSGTKPIDIAKNDNNQEIMELLTKDEASKDEEIKNQKLMAAVKANDVNTVKTLLIDKDVDVINAKAPLVGDRFDGYTPLLTAAFLGHDKIVKMLLDAGADPTKVDDQIKATPAHKAGYHGRTETAKVLVEKAVEKGLDLNAQGPYNGYTALHDAIWHCHKETVEVFLNAPQDVPQVRLDLKTHSGHMALGLAELYCGPDSEIVTLIKAKGGQ